MSKKNDETKLLSMRACAKSLIREAESKRHGDGSESMRLSQAAVNITNAMHNLQALK